jgi:hypothetical protein
MFRLPRPLIVGLGVVPPALMILTEHPWIAAATFTGVFATLLLRPRDRAPAQPVDAREPAAGGPVGTRDLVLSGPAPAYEEEPARPRDGLIHYPPRRLPL